LAKPRAPRNSSLIAKQTSGRGNRKNEAFISPGAACFSDCWRNGAKAGETAARRDLETYDRLLKQIDRIPIYDNHSHATFPDDSDMDAAATPPRKAPYAPSDTNRIRGRGSALWLSDDFSPNAKWLIDKKRPRAPAAWRTGTASSTK
jgi:hypothetical protein